MPDPETSLADVTEIVWAQRQNLTGGLREIIVENELESRLLVPSVALDDPSFSLAHSRDDGGGSAS